MHTVWSAAYLATLAGADSIVVSWRFVLTYKAGLVDARRRWGWGGAGDEQVLSWTRALGLYSCRRRKIREINIQSDCNYNAFLLRHQHLSASYLSWVAVRFGAIQIWFISWKGRCPLFFGTVPNASGARLQKSRSRWVDAGKLALIHRWQHQD